MLALFGLELIIGGERHELLEDAAVAFLDLLHELGDDGFLGLDHGGGASLLGLRE